MRAILEGKYSKLMLLQGDFPPLLFSMTVCDSVRSSKPVCTSHVRTSKPVYTSHVQVVNVRSSKPVCISNICTSKPARASNK